MKKKIIALMISLSAIVPAAVIAIFNIVSKRMYVMNYRLFILQIIYLFFLGSCSHKQAEPISKLTHKTVDLGNQFIGIGGFLAYCQDAVVGIEMSPSMQTPFFFLKSDEPSPTFHFFGNKGRGPNEFLLPYSIQHVDNQTVGVFDVRTNTYSEFIIPREHEALLIKKEIRFQTRLSRIIKTAYNQYISLSLNEDMFSLVDSIGVPVDTFFEYPYQNSAERKLENRAFAYQGTLAVNPSKTKFAYSSFRGEIIHFYAIENNNIEVIAKIENEYPLYRENDDGTQGVKYDVNSKNGYIATYATEKFVYAIYSGQTILEQTEKRSFNFEGNILHIFDWNGALVKEYELDVLCSYLCVSDDDSKIWAIATTQYDIALVSFDLENPIENRKSNETQKAIDLTERKPMTRNMYRMIVQTKDGKQNDQTRKVLDSLMSLPAHVGTDLTNFDFQMDTIDNIVNIVITLK